MISDGFNDSLVGTLMNGANFKGYIRCKCSACIS